MDMTHFTFKVTVYEWTVYAVIGQTCPALSPAAAVSSVAVLSPSAGCCSHSAGWSSLSAVYQSAALSLTSETHTPSSGSHSPSAAAPARSLHHTRTINKHTQRHAHKCRYSTCVHTHTDSRRYCYITVEVMWEMWVIFWISVWLLQTLLWLLLDEPRAWFVTSTNTLYHSSGFWEGRTYSPKRLWMCRRH